jgi:broad specificity phosphatase PhoE
MTTFYLIRHGHKEAIPFDPPLTSLGLKQAEITAELLKNVTFTKVLSSPKLRTLQTAEIIAKLHSLPVIIDERLAERVEWENDETFKEFIAEWNKTDIDRSYLPKKGMSSKIKGEKMKDILDELSEKHKDGIILIVSHGGTIGDLLRNLFTERGIEHKTEPISGANYIDILECGITTLRKTGDNYKLLKIGDISHLSSPNDLLP